MVHRVSLKVVVVVVVVKGKVVHHGFSIFSSFSQRVRLQQPIHSLSKDARFYAKRLRSNKDELEPRRKSKVWATPLFTIGKSHLGHVLTHFNIGGIWGIILIRGGCLYQCYTRPGLWMFGVNKDKPPFKKNIRFIVSTFYVVPQVLRILVGRTTHPNNTYGITQCFHLCLNMYG